MMNSSTITTTKLTAVTPAFQMTLFLLQQPRPPDVLSVHVVVKAAVGVWQSIPGVVSEPDPRKISQTLFSIFRGSGSETIPGESG